MKFENTEVFNFEGAFRGMRNPLNSWGKSDSVFHFVKYVENAYSDINAESVDCCKLGENDLRLAQSLIRAGSEHRKFMRQIFIQTELEANVYEWLKMENKFIEKSALPDDFENLKEIKRFVSMNYEVAFSTKYKYGKDYDEWLKTLPYAQELIFVGE